MLACQPSDKSHTNTIAETVQVETNDPLPVPKSSDSVTTSASSPVDQAPLPATVSTTKEESPAQLPLESQEPLPEPDKLGSSGPETAIPDHIISKPDHSIWDGILKKYVSASGQVNYRSLKTARGSLDQYLNYLKENPLNPDWDRQVQLAYWINAYNAFTVDLILRHYPLKSIMDLQKPWDQKFIQLGDKRYSLNQIEHEIVRPVFQEPRIHFALVCAATSCPKLLNTAYRWDLLDKQLDSQTRYFLNRSGKNEISEDKVVVSQLFNWYGEDFTKTGTLIDYLNDYASIKISKSALIEFAEYDWSLNE